ncbi:MAG TPA: hypothetical protein VHJ20_23835 [Polyangia bacterium]|nr:hypothetical protein [Polyangia bacterium]
MTPAFRRALAIVAGVGALATVMATLAPRDAAAFVRYKTASGIPFAWQQTCVPVTYYPNSMLDGAGHMNMTPDQIAHAVSTSAATWSAAANPCSFLIINTESSAAAAPTAVYDKRNSLIFDSTWCGPRDGSGNCTYDGLALAITSVFVVTSTGVIKDADIEINTQNFTWADLDLEPPGSDKQDLQNAVTHEMGHMIGLDHTCYMNGEATRQIDNNGNPVPDCATAPADVRATTMFASADAGDIQKRTLADDDKAAVCAIYPVANDPMMCPTAADPTGSTSSGCHCAVDPARGRATFVAPGLLVAAALWARARRRRAGPAA